VIEASVTELARETVGILVFVAGLSALALFALLAGGLILSSYRVAVQRRPLVLPFRGSETTTAGLTALVVIQLLEVERRWVRRVGEVGALKEEFEAESKSAPKAELSEEGPESPLADGTPLPQILAREGVAANGYAGIAGTGSGPRSTGDETIEYVLELGENSLADADLGVVSVAGVSFSPQAILALLRRLPGTLARRRISGTLVELGGASTIAVTYEERDPFRPTRSARRLVQVAEDNWSAAIETLAFQLAKGRIEVLRDRRADKSAVGGSKSDTAERAFIEAESWASCEAFLAAYAHQLRHYISGTGSDREKSLALYTEALAAQPGFTRAHHNLATLLYNRYRRPDNRLAIEHFAAATESEDDRVQALAYAGLAMAYGQETQRFKEPREKFVAQAKDASAQALALDPSLEESHFAAAWALQIDEQWAEAISAYEKVDELETESVPGDRIKSFASNNAAWVMLNELPPSEAALRRAEVLLWKAVSLYPNKIAYVNLAEVARRHENYAASERLFSFALELDRNYAAAWHELALLGLERATRAADLGEAEEGERFYEKSLRDQHTAEEIGDEQTAASLKDEFQRALKKRSGPLGLGKKGPKPKRALRRRSSQQVSRARKG
jgi:tetratricopeptide (TPR) repeat protein